MPHSNQLKFGSGCASLVITALVLLLPHTARAAAESDAVPNEIIVGVRADSDDANEPGRLAEAGEVHRHIAGIHAHHLKLTPGLTLDKAIQRLLKHHEVLYVEPNYVLHAQAAAVPSDPYYSANQFAPQKMQADLAWTIWQPVSPVSIAILDTGVDNTHPDLVNKIARDGSGNILGFDAYKEAPADALDDNGHGTACAGVAAAETNNGVGIAGIAGWNGTAGSDTTNVKIMPVKVMDSTGQSSDDAVTASGIVWAADHGAKIISMSIGGPNYSNALADAISYAWSKGCVLVAAAGNSGVSTMLYPAAFPNVLSVGATDSNDTMTSYSNYGSWVLVAAPGGVSAIPVVSTCPTYASGAGVPLNYGGWVGTSIACPHVAGEAALIMSQYPSLSNSQVDHLITTNVDPYTAFQGHTGMAAGAGRVNIFRALQAAAGLAPTPAPTGLGAAGLVGQVSLAWIPVPGATSYNVRRSTVSGGPYTLISTAGSVTTGAFLDTSVTSSGVYYYVVTAVGIYGESNDSAQVSAAPLLVAGAAATPTLTATPGDGQITLAWSASLGATSCNIKYGIVGAPFLQTSPQPAGPISLSLTGLTNGATYYFVISAVTGAWESGNSAPVLATPTAAGTPAAPTGLTAVPGNGQVVLNWGASAGATSYVVKRALASGGPYVSLTPNPTAASFTDTGAHNGATYSYTVAGINGAGQGAPCAAVTAAPSSSARNLVLANSGGPLAFWSLTGTAVTSGAFATINGTPINIPAGWQVVGTGDFNNDGSPDLLLSNPASGQLVVWFMNGGAVTSGVYISMNGAALNLPSTWKIAGVADFNGDGSVDLAMQNTSGQLVIWLMRGTTVTSGVYVTQSGGAISLPQGWRVIGVGDFNGDRSPDLLLENMGSGLLAVWTMNGTSVGSGAYVTNLGGGGAVVPGGWNVAGVGDVNGDGLPDMVLTNAAGQIAFWLMNGGVVNSGVYATQGGSPINLPAGWQVVGTR